MASSAPRPGSVHAAGVLPDLEQDFEDQSLEPGRLAFWLNDRMLFTTRRKPVRAVQRLHDAVANGLELENPAAALAKLLGSYVEIVESRLIQLSAELDKIEDKILADRSGLDRLPLGPLRHELSRHRREFTGLRSAIHRAGFARLTGETPLGAHMAAMHQDAEDFERDAGAHDEQLGKPRFLGRAGGEIAVDRRADLGLVLFGERQQTLQPVLAHVQRRERLLLEGPALRFKSDPEGVLSGLQHRYLPFTFR